MPVNGCCCGGGNIPIGSCTSNLCQFVFLLNYSYNMFPNTLGAPNADNSPCGNGQWTGGWQADPMVQCAWTTNQVHTGGGTSNITLSQTSSTMTLVGSTLTMTMVTDNGDNLWTGRNPATGTGAVVVTRTSGNCTVNTFTVVCSRNMNVTTDCGTGNLTVVVGGTMLNGCPDVIPNGTYALTYDGAGASWSFNDFATASINIARMASAWDVWTVLLSNGIATQFANEVFIESNDPVQTNCPRAGTVAWNKTHKSWTSRTFTVTR